MRHWGRCHVELDRKTLGRLLLWEPEGLVVNYARYNGPEYDWDGKFINDYYQVEISCHDLPEGYHGQMNIIINNNTYRFKPDQDT